MRRILLTALVLCASVFFYSCDQTPPVTPENPQSSAVLSKAEISYPPADYFVVEYTSSEAELTDAVNAQDGTVLNIFPAIKVAQVGNLSDQSASKLEKSKGVKSVVRDQMVQWVKPETDVDEQSIGNDETFWAYQWAPRAISAPQAWDAGYTGQGVKVAVIDGGISSNHIDLVDNIDFAASTSFVPGYTFDQDAPGFRHATHVAGIIAAEDNSIGTIGIAPHAKIIAIKALQNGSGSFSAVIASIIYAADKGADVINMSLGAVFPRNSKSAAQLNAALGLAMSYAYQKGSTIVVAAGNEGIDFDHAYMYVSMPAEAQHVICVSATGPVNFAYGGSNFDKQASYTNYGQSLVDFAAPGGDDTLYPDSTYWYLDMVLSPSYVVGTSNRYSWADGTSMAAPHVAGVAALIIQKYGHISPAQVEAKLRASSDDLGKPGNDDYYGLGRVNAFKAVTY